MDDVIYTLEQLEDMIFHTTNSGDLVYLVDLNVSFPKRKGTDIVDGFDVVKTVLVCGGTIGLEVAVRCAECGEEPILCVVCAGPGYTAQERWTQVYKDSKHVADIKRHLYVCEKHQVDDDERMIAAMLMPSSLLRALLGGEEEISHKNQEDDPLTPPEHRGRLN